MVASMDTRHQPQERLGRPRRPGGHPLAGRHQGGRHAHRAVQPRQAVRRLPVPGVLVLVQHGHAAAQLRGQLPQERRSAPAPGCSRATSPTRAPPWSRTPPTGARTPRDASFPTWTRSTTASSTDTSAANLQLQSRHRRRPAADGLPGRPGGVHRPQPEGRHLPVHRHPRGRLQHQQGAVDSDPSESARQSPTASTARPSTRRCTAAAATSATTPSGSRRSSRAARPRPRAPRTTPRPSAALRRRASQRHRRHADRRQLPREPGATRSSSRRSASRPASTSRSTRSATTPSTRRADQRRLRNTPWLNAPMVIVEWGSRPTPGSLRAGHAAADAAPGARRTGTTSSSSTPFNQYESTTDEATRTTLATQLSTIQQDETPIVVAFYISQLRTQKKNVYEHPGSGLVLLQRQPGVHDRVRPADGHSN